MDWSASGIENSFEFELIDPFDLDESRGFLGSVTGGTLTEEHGSDYFSSLSLDIDGDELDGVSLVRVWHVAKLAGESVREEMGTFFQESRDTTLQLGRSTGSLDFQSTLFRLGTDLRKGDRSVAAGKSILGHFQEIVENAGGTPWIDPSLEDQGFSASHVWEAAGSVLDEAKLCAQAIGAEIGVDTHGRVQLVRSINPANRTGSFSIPQNSNSVTEPGVDLGNPEIINRVVASYERDDIRYFAAAEVAATHPWHFAKIGRWATEELTVDEIEDGEDVQAVLDSAVADRLAEATAVGTTYTTSMLYLPIRAGDVGAFAYRDSSGAQIGSRQVILTQREVDLDATMRMQCTFQEV